MPRRLAIGLVAVAIAGCGGGGPSTVVYRQRLNAACERAARQNRRLPEIQRRRSLSLTQLGRLAARNGRRFRATVVGLAPPSSLKDADAALIRELRQPGVTSSPAVARRRLLAFADSYRALGANACLAETKRDLRRLAAVRRPPGPLK